MSRNIYELFLNKFAKSLDRPFLTIPGGLTYTYGQLDRRSAAIATVLSHNGAVPGDRIAVQVDKSPDGIALYMACLRGGFVFVPLSSRLSVEEVGFFLGDAEPRIFVCNESDVTRLTPVAEIVGVNTIHTLSSTSTGTLADAANEITPVTAVAETNADDVACILYTAGHTGRAKGTMLTHKNLVSNMRALHAIWRWRPGDVLLHTLPVTNTFGLFVALHTAMVNVSEVIFLQGYNRDMVIQNLPKVTVVMDTPQHLEDLLTDAEFGSLDCRTVRLFVSGSGPLSHSTFRNFAERTGHGICECYLSTECGVISSNPPEGERLAGSVGYALPNVETRVIDPTGNILSSGEIGEVQVKGPTLFAGYWQMDDATKKSITSDGFLHTGDVGFFANDGRLTLAGRVNNLVISGGHNIYPKEIEIILDNVHGVFESAAIGLAHPELGQAIAVFVVADPRVTVESLEAAIADKAQPYKMPREFVFVDDLPKTSMGVVQKSQLSAKHAELFTAGSIG